MKKKRSFIGKVIWGVVGLFLLLLIIGLIAPTKEEQKTVSPAPATAQEPAAIRAPATDAEPAPLPVSKAAAPVDGSETMLRDAIGCLERDTQKRLGAIAADRDREAFVKLATSLLQTGACKTLHAGDAVYLADTAVFSGLICVRPKGETECLWVTLDAAK